jgi:hypothetical protein
MKVVMENAITSQPESEIDKFRHKIQDWLLQEEWVFGDLTDPEAFWVIRAEQPGVTILHPVQRMDRVEIVGAMNLSDDHRKKFMALDGQKRQDFIQELTLMLLNTELGFAFESNPLQTVVISHRIYFDALTKDEFLIRVSSVLKGMALVRHFVQRKFNEVKPENQFGFKLS